MSGRSINFSQTVKGPYYSGFKRKGNSHQQGKYISTSMFKKKDLPVEENMRVRNEHFMSSCGGQLYHHQNFNSNHCSNYSNNFMYSCSDCIIPFTKTYHEPLRCAHSKYNYQSICCNNQEPSRANHRYRDNVIRNSEYQFLFLNNHVPFPKNNFYHKINNQKPKDLNQTKEEQEELSETKNKWKIYMKSESQDDTNTNKNSRFNTQLNNKENIKLSSNFVKLENSENSSKNKNSRLSNSNKNNDQSSSINFEKLYKQQTKEEFEDSNNTHMNFNDEIDPLFEEIINNKGLKKHLSSKTMYKCFTENSNKRSSRRNSKKKEFYKNWKIKANPNFNYENKAKIQNNINFFYTSLDQFESPKFQINSDKMKTKKQISFKVNEEIVSSKPSNLPSNFKSQKKRESDKLNCDSFCQGSFVKMDSDLNGSKLNQVRI